MNVVEAVAALVVFQAAPLIGADATMARRHRLEDILQKLDDDRDGRVKQQH